MSGVTLSFEDSIKVVEEARKIKIEQDRLIASMSDVNLFSSFASAIPFLLKDTNFKMILMTGTTPSFADGDPCNHSYDIFYGKRSEREAMDDINEYTDYFYEQLEADGLEETDDADDLYLFPMISEIDCKRIESIFESINLALEITGHTDFKFTVYKNKNNEISVEFDDSFYKG